MTTPLFTFAPLVTGIGACVAAALDSSLGGRPSGFDTCLLVPQRQISWDNCSCGGRLAQAITDVYGSDRFPTPADLSQNWSHCGPPLQVASVVVQTTRCVPTVDNQGRMPSCAELEAAALIIESDRAVVRQALFCCLFDLRNRIKTGQPGGISAFAIGTSALQPDLGGCAAVETTYLIGVSSCNCGAT